MTTSGPMTRRRRGSPASVTALTVICGFVGLLYAIELVDAVLDHRLDREGIEPQQADGLPGILFAPLLHAGWEHLLGNTVPLLVLGFLVLVSGVRLWAGVTAITWLVAGLGTWLVAPAGTIHLGASVLIFGWLVFLLLRGFVTGRLRQILLGVVILFLYGGVLWSVLPGQPGISWQGHLFGAIGGAIAALLLTERRQPSGAAIR